MDGEISDSKYVFFVWISGHVHNKAQQMGATRGPIENNDWPQFIRVTGLAVPVQACVSLFTSR